MSNMSKIMMDLNVYIDEMELLAPVRFNGEKVIMLDQLKLPLEEVYMELSTCEEVGKGIKDMNTRGAGAIALSAAYGLLLSAINGKGDIEKMRQDAQMLSETRPTAVALFKSINKIMEAVQKEQPSPKNMVDFVEILVDEIVRERVMFEINVGKSGASVVKLGETILTHCHAGAVASGGYGGSSLSIFRQAQEQGKNITVFSDETRPYLQGARITMWELMKFDIPSALITDNMAGYFMKAGKIDRVIVSADRIAANGDTANKIGTYSVAVLAKEHGIPFHIASSSSGFDMNTATGDDIPIEMREATEVVNIRGVQVAPYGANALYPAFDVTPNKYIESFFTDQGVILPPFDVNIVKLMNKVK